MLPSITSSPLNPIKATCSRVQARLPAWSLLVPAVDFFACTRYCNRYSIAATESALYG